MASLDESTPVIVGIGRHTMRAASVEAAMTPMQLLLTAVNQAVLDLGLPRHKAEEAMRATGAVCTCNIGPVTVPTIAGGDGSWTNVYTNPPKSVAQSLGASVPDDRLISGLASGHQPQLLVNLVADGISRGDFSTGVVCGCEFLHTLKHALKEGYSLKDGNKKLNWGDDPGGRPTRVKGNSYRATPKEETIHGLSVPINTYPLLETALRSHLGRSIEDHSRKFSEMWAGFSRVAASQPEHAWFPQARTPEEICVPGEGNRWVGTPYTKFHCSFLDVDQSAAVVLMSVAEARRRGVPEHKWVYLLGGAEATEKDTLLRPELHRSPAAGMVGQKCFAQAGVPVDRIDHFDIYSCFPSAVQIVARELGVDHTDGTKLTTTGGVPFHGGPGANYSTHAIVAMVERLREHPGDFGMVTANGGFLSKHAAGIYSTTPYKALHPAATQWQREDPKGYQAQLDSAPDVRVASAPLGFGHVETYTVAHGAKGPTQAIVIGTVEDGPEMGKRFVAVSNDKSTLQRMLAQDALGMRVKLSAEDKGRSTFVLADLASAKL